MSRAVGLRSAHPAERPPHLLQPPLGGQLATEFARHLRIKAQLAALGAARVLEKHS
jgi:hypothetical protein